jgi:hypothetical protein
MEIQGMLDVGDDATPPPSLLEDDTLELGAAVLLMQAPYVERAPVLVAGGLLVVEGARP